MRFRRILNCAHMPAFIVVNPRSLNTVISYKCRCINYQLRKLYVFMSWDFYKCTVDQNSQHYVDFPTRKDNHRGMIKIYLILCTVLYNTHTRTSPSALAKSDHTLSPRMLTNYYQRKRNKLLNMVTLLLNVIM